MTLKLVFALWFIVCLALASAQEAQRYTNPVVTPVAADPDVIRAEDGSFYLYATQDNWADGSGDHYIPIFRSDDLVNWTFVEDAFSGPPAWKESGGFYWAPDISLHGGTYYLYYAYSLWGDPNPCIGLATATAPEGPWEDLGRAVFCSEDIGVENSIDPFVWYEDGERTMIWGSFNGIYAVELNEDGTEAVGETTLLADTRFEAPYVVKRDGYYHLFLAAGSCCDGEWSTYTTYAGRSEDLLGPYLDSQGRDLKDGGGDLILEANEVWVGPGHSAVVTDAAGADWLVYHAIPRADPRLENGVNRRPALLDRLEFEFLAPSDNPIRLRAAELIAQDLNAAGFDITVRAIENEALVERAWPDFDVSQGRNYQMSMFGWSAPVNSQGNLLGLLHSDPTKGNLNLSGYANPEVDALTDEAAVTTDEAARRDLLFQVQEILARDLPLITLFYQDGIYAYRPAAYDDWTYMAGQGIINLDC